MRNICILPSFKRSAKSLSFIQKQRLAESLKKFNHFICTGEASAGLGFKKIYYDKYEFRVDIRLRVILKEEGDTYYLVLVGSHDQIKRYLREQR